MSLFKKYLNSYVFETTLPGKGIDVSFRPVTTGQIKKLLLYETSNDPMSIENALDEVMQECIVKPDDFDIKDQYVQDRFFLLVEMRKATRGAQYNFQTECSSCGSQTQQMLNLSSLPVTVLNKNKKEVKKQTLPSLVKPKRGKLVEKTEDITEQPKVDEKYEWDVVKLNTNISIRLTLITRGMQQEAYDIFKLNHNSNINDINEIEKTLEITTALYALSIVSVITPEGEETNLPLEERIFLLDNIQQSEQEKISKWFEDHDFGLDFSFDVKCSHCGFTEKKAVPVENFFY